jgi:hypothetical protein
MYCFCALVIYRELDTLCADVCQVFYCLNYRLLINLFTKDFESCCF